MPSRLGRGSSTRPSPSLLAAQTGHQAKWASAGHQEHQTARKNPLADSSTHYTAGDGLVYEAGEEDWHHFLRNSSISSSHLLRPQLPFGHVGKARRQTDGDLRHHHPPAFGAQKEVALHGLR
ncbi:hypothetical protein SEVIR_5G242501v4 [Setaria viridis]|uniref:Uncharacterized protein n=1 Tax=Setaria viridis TaxID=4556 RepID=A0A4U6UHA5_SETVI|nr:hypothetical protein SEVIR_5G242501v2 [Setaria viridis]